MSFFSADTQDRIRKFRKIKRARVSLWLVTILFGLSCVAELLANNRPIVFSYHDHVFFPVFNTYRGTEFNLDTPVEPVYKDLLKTPGVDWVIWPPIRWGDNESNRTLDTYPSAPSADNLLGTDDRGRDILTRLIYGFRVSMFFGLISLVVAVFIAIIVGGIQGYLGGITDLVGQRLIEVWSSLPYLYVLILLVNIYEPNIGMLILANAVFAWIGLSYYVRAEVLKTRKMAYVEAAQALGCKTSRIIGWHVIPNSFTPIITFAPFIINLAINNLAVLDYLGLGVQPPTASIGELLRQGKAHFTTSWWLAVYPFLVLVVTIVMLNFVGEGVREAFDPRKAQR